MGLTEIIFSVLLLLPFVVAAGLLVAYQSGRNFGLGWNVGVTSIVFVLLATIFVMQFGGEWITSLRLPFFQSYNINWKFSLDTPRLVFLALIQLCLFIAYVVSSDDKKTNKMPICIMMLFAQGILNAYLVSENIVLMAALHVVGYGTIYCLIKFYLWDEQGKADKPIYFAEAMMFVQFIVGASLAVWGIVTAHKLGVEIFEYPVFVSALNDSSDQLGKSYMVGLLACMVLLLPVFPWSRWYFDLIENPKLPKILFVPATCFLSVSIWLFGGILLSMFPAQMNEHRSGFVAAGVLMCLLSALRTNSGMARMLGSVIIFFMGLIVFMFGFASQEVVVSIFLSSILLASFPVLVFFMLSDFWESGRYWIIAAAMFLVMIGVPGTPVFYVFGLLGTAILSNHFLFLTIFSLIWLLYIYLVVNSCRDSFLRTDLSRSEGIVLNVSRVRALCLGICIGLLLVLIVVVGNTTDFIFGATYGG